MKEVGLVVASISKLELLKSTIIGVRLIAVFDKRLDTLNFGKKAFLFSVLLPLFAEYAELKLLLAYQWKRLGLHTANSNGDISF